LNLTINFENGHRGGMWFDDANRASAPKSGMRTAMYAESSRF
jgi:hypothetical protein